MDEIRKTYDQLEGYAGGFSIRFSIEALFDLIRQDLGLDFYERFGFEKRPCDWDGPGMFKMIR